MMLTAVFPATALTSQEKEEQYNAAVQQLETYLESSGNSSAELAGIRAAFEELGGYGYSRFLGYYTAVLMMTAEEEYNYDLFTLLDMMSVNTRFCAYLEDLRESSSIGTVLELEAYVGAREQEHRGNLAQAWEGYRQCLNFFDADRRYMEIKPDGDKKEYEKAKELLRQGDYAGAYYGFISANKYGDSEDIMASIENQLGYKPASPEDNLKPVTGLRATGRGKDSVTLSWMASAHAKTYEVYFKPVGNSEWRHAGDTEKTEMTITGLSAGGRYDFQVVAALDRIKAEGTALRDQSLVTPSPVPVKAGQYVKFGHYPQTAAGNDSTPIEWLVLEVQGNRALLLSRYGLDAKPYNKELTEVTWETCTLRSWLNGEFMRKAFTVQEQTWIQTTTVDNSARQGFDWRSSGGEKTSGGNNTQDKIFLLSYAEANRYLGVTWEGGRNLKSATAPTGYAIKQGADTYSDYKTADGTAAGWWWLRSPGSFRKDAARVYPDGSLDRNYVYDDSGCVRPALWLDLESDIF